jgi:hypothetical protein
MSATKHTPGPWRWANDGGDGYAIHSSSKKMSATVALVTARVGSETAIADSRVLAAAPEMLAALHTLRKLYGAIDDALCMDPRFPWESAPQAYKDAWRSVRNLIRKAEGIA